MTSKGQQYQNVFLQQVSLWILALEFHLELTFTEFLKNLTFLFDQKSSHLLNKICSVVQIYRKSTLRPNLSNHVLISKKAILESFDLLEPRFHLM